MKTLKSFIFIILYFLLFSIFFTLPTFASNINMNLAQEQNIADNSINNDISNQDSVSNTQLDTNTVATVQSVEQFEDNTSSFDITNIINILLLAVGLVIILLAVAILIRLKR